MDTLGALTLFTKVVETGSFSEAGRQSGLAPSSVSRRIVELEGWVGAALFYRTTRKLNLTEVGQSFYERTRSILLDLEEAKVMAAQLEDHPSGLIRLTIPASMERHMTSAISDFQARWPGVRFALTFTDRVVDLVGEGFDLAVRMGRLEDSTLRARKIGEARRFLCASPRYLGRAGTPGRPEDLASHSCLIFRTHPGYNVWRFKAGDRTVDVRASGSFSANSGTALINAARDGMGLVLVPEWLVGPSLVNGELVEVMPNHPSVPERTPLYAVHPYQSFVPPKVKTFVEFLAKRYGKDYDWTNFESI
ncbi:MAG: LysR family transcriptional regulator [Sneathiella sp.]|nr:LysR family transcriptional regulator [Sneathiella sp.]